MVGAGAERLAIAMLVQRELGLRPSEVLSLEAKDISFPEHRQDRAGERAVIALGVRAGTKAKRAQAVVLRNAVLVGLLRYLCATARRDEPIVGVSYSTYRKLIIKIEGILKIDLGLTPHSPRSGFATEAIQDGHDFTAVKEGGRWVSDASLRQYVDMVAVSQIQADLHTRGLAPLLSYASENWLSFFPRAEPYLAPGSDAASWLGAGAGGRLLPAVGPPEWASAARLPDAAVEEEAQGGHATAAVGGSATRSSPRPGGRPASGRGPQARARSQSPRRLRGVGAASSRGAGRGRSRAPSSSTVVAPTHDDVPQTALQALARGAGNRGRGRAGRHGRA